MPTKKQSSYGNSSTSKRQLVRWNDPLQRADGVIENLDRFLMLAIQSVCNNRGVKIPWELVAEVMGPPITEGAVVQHLAKLRQRLEEAGQLVPPPLRRGGATPISKSSKGNGVGSAGGAPLNVVKSMKRKARITNNDDDEEDESVDIHKAGGVDDGYKGSSKKRGKIGNAKKAIKAEDSDDYETPVKKNRRAKVKKYNSDDDDDDDFKDSTVTHSMVPTITRNRKSSINYAQLNGEDGSESETEFGGSVGSNAGEEQYVTKVVGKNSKGKGEGPSPSKAGRRKVIVLPVSLPSQHSEKSPGAKVIKDEESDYEIKSIGSGDSASPAGSLKEGVKQHLDREQYGATSQDLLQQDLFAGQNHHVRLLEPVPNSLPINRPAYDRTMDGSQMRGNQSYGSSNPDYHSFAGFGMPIGLHMGPPLSNNTHQSRSMLGNGMRIDTGLVQTYPSYSTTADNSYSSMNPSPSSATVRNPMDMNFTQNSANLSTGYLGTQGEDDNNNFLSNAFLSDTSDNSWMDELFPGAGFGQGTGF